jgi:hypothetical protein
VQIIGTHVETDAVVFYSQVRSIRFNPDPLQVEGLVFRLLDVKLPKAGLYWVECRMNGKLVAQQTLRLKERS